MKYRPIDILRKFVMRKCIEHLIVTSKCPVWVNLTFWENVTNKEYANKCWNRLRMALMREYPDFRMVGVWARQGRGAWHIHAVVNQRIDVNWLRRKAMRAGFGPQMFLKECDDKAETPEKLARYICGYVTDKNALDPEKDKGIRRTIFVGKHVKVVDMRYKSALKQITSEGRDMCEQISEQDYKAMSKFERDFSSPSVLGRKKIFESWGEWYRRNRDWWFEVAWSNYSLEEQEELAELDEYLQRYLTTGRWSYV